MTGSSRVDFSLEERARGRGFAYAIGVDEAGRGPWAGPVTAAAVAFPHPSRAPEGLDDSKRLSASARERLASAIRSEATFAVAFVDRRVIDERNVLNASLRAMETAVERVLRALRRVGEATTCAALIDGNRVPLNLPRGVEGIAVVGGDGISASIAAASILAKTSRDRFMRGRADRLYPGYGFASHKGYGSRSHAEALRRLGACPLHRRSFAPVARRIAEDMEASEDSSSGR